MKFCPECNNLLYIVEEDALYNVCKKCGHKEENEDTIVIKNNYQKKQFKNSGSKQYMIYDPSYARTIHHKCPNGECPSKEDPKKQCAIMFAEDGELEATYICCECKYEWKY